MTKQGATIIDLPDRLEGESSEKYWRRVERWLTGEDVRSKVDLKDWTGSPPFHLAPERENPK